MPFTYAIGDLHGRLDVLDACLDLLSKREAGRIVFLGDYVDRGPDSKGVIERLMAGSQDHHQWVILKGNHEEMASMAHARPENFFKWWFRNGGEQTLHSYGAELDTLAPQTDQGLFMAYGRVMERDHLTWMDCLPLFYKDDRRLYVHAGIRKKQRWEDDGPEVLIWIRHQRGEETPELNGLHIVHGHTPYQDGPVLLQTRTNLDTTAWKTGRAAIGVFDDDIDGGPVNVLEVRCGFGTRRIKLDDYSDK